jgi:hypothetical protein
MRNAVSMGIDSKPLTGKVTIEWVDAPDPNGGPNFGWSLHVDRPFDDDRLRTLLLEIANSPHLNNHRVVRHSPGLPADVTVEMVEALKRREDVRLPDGRRVGLVRAYAPLSSKEEIWSVYVEEHEYGLPKVRLSPDYGAPSPLWPLSDETEDLVPESLFAKLVEWQADFDSNYRWDSGWQSEEAKARWAAAAVDLEAELREALDGNAALEVDLWPLESG